MNKDNLDKIREQLRRLGFDVSIEQAIRACFRKQLPKLSPKKRTQDKWRRGGRKM